MRLVLAGKQGLFLGAMNTTVVRGWTKWGARIKLELKENQLHPGILTIS